MTIDAATKEIKERWRDFLPMILQPAKVKVNGENSFICPFCGHGAHGDGLTYNRNSDNKTGLHCFGCGFTGSDIDLYAKMNGYDLNDKKVFVQTVKEMAEMLGITIENASQPSQPRPESNLNSTGDKLTAETQNGLESQNKGHRTQNTPGRYKEKIEKAAADLYTPAGKRALEYLYKRGLTDETIKRYRIGYSENEYFPQIEKKSPAIIFPHNAENSYYSARSIDGKYFIKPGEKEAGKQPLYNPAALYKADPAFIVESPIDALSIIQSGGNAAALVGTAWANTLIPALEKITPESPLILCLDYDEMNPETGKRQGQEAQKALGAALTDRKIPFINADIDRQKYAPPVKDANDLLRSDPERLKQDVRQNAKKAMRRAGFIPYQVNEYLEKGLFETDINYFKAYKDRKTGFSNIDKYLTLFPGMAALGGSASIGKTSFSICLADNLIKAGETVLYFALEQEPIELITKSLARKLYENDPYTKLTNIDIKNGATDNALETIKKEYAAETQNRYYIIRSDFTTTADSIRDYTETFIKKTGKKPVVFIDYLQLVSPPADFKGDTRAATDYAIKTFKTMQLDNELLVILISNFNRAGYDTPVTYSDFKESGAIEYTCDYLWGMQLSLLSQEAYYTRTGSQGGNHSTTDHQKDEMLNKALTAYPKKVQFVSLKNRNGKQRFTCDFRYYMKHDVFVPDEYASAQRGNDPGETGPENDFLEIPENGFLEIPFDISEN